MNIWLKHPIRALYWRFRLRGKIKVSIDPKIMVAKDFYASRETKRAVLELLTEFPPTTNKESKDEL